MFHRFRSAAERRNPLLEASPRRAHPTGGVLAPRGRGTLALPSNSSNFESIGDRPYFPVADSPIGIRGHHDVLEARRGGIRGKDVLRACAAFQEIRHVVGEGVLRLPAVREAGLEEIVAHASAAVADAMKEAMTIQFIRIPY